jgi:hypothetical protein
MCDELPQLLDSTGAMPTKHTLNRTCRPLTGRTPKFSGPPTNRGSLWLLLEDLSDSFRAQLTGASKAVVSDEWLVLVARQKQWLVATGMAKHRQKHEAPLPVQTKRSYSA